MAINLDSYRFRGMQAEGRGGSLDEAIDDLVDFWSSRPSLVSHMWGLLTLQITIGSTEAVIQITDPDILDDLESGNLQPLMQMLALDMGMSLEETKVLFAETISVVATVDRIRPPSQPKAWRPDTDADPSIVLPKASLAWLRDVGRQIDREVRRDPNRSRTRRGKTLLRMVVESGSKQGLSDAQISSRTGIPRSTVRDARLRIDRASRVAKEFQSRRPGQRLSSEQKTIVQKKLSENSGNAAKTARQLGLSPRTVRDLRAQQKASSSSSTKKSSGPSSYTAKDRSELLKLVASGVNPTAAGRQLQIPARTARGWARKAKLDTEK